jgi:hypothetical protein
VSAGAKLTGRDEAGEDMESREKVIGTKHLAAALQVGRYHKPEGKARVDDTKDRMEIAAKEEEFHKMVEKKTSVDLTVEGSGEGKRKGSMEKGMEQTSAGEREVAAGKREKTTTSARRPESTLNEEAIFGNIEDEELGKVWDCLEENNIKKFNSYEAWYKHVIAELANLEE